MKSVWIVAKRELGSYFATPIAAIFIVIFLILAGLFMFNMSGFYENGQADLSAFFNWHPILYAVLVPAIAMRLWSEERRSGTIELLMTLPISPAAAVVGKFLAAWMFTGIALLLTFPIVWTVNYLGEPDNGAIFASYLGSFLMAGAFLSVGALMSALTKNQVIAFVASTAMCLLFLLLGFPAVLDAISNWAPQVVVELFASFGFIPRFAGLAKGVVELDTLLYFGSLIVLMLFLNTLAVERLKAA